jgi:tetratricopeptide (TPR) repeat protein
MVGYGNVLAIRKQYDSAALMYDKAFTTNPHYFGAAYAKGAMYYNLERYSDCIAFMDRLLRENTDYFDGMLLIGDCYYSLKQFDDAIVWYENAYENGGSRSSALCHLMAYIYDTKGDYGKAISLYQEALQYDSSIVSIYKRLGELLPSEDGNYYRTQAIKLEE